MADLSQMSDDDLKAAYAKMQPQQAAPQQDLSHISDEDLKAAYAKQNPNETPFAEGSNAQRGYRAVAKAYKGMVPTEEEMSNPEEQQKAKEGLEYATSGRPGPFGRLSDQATISALQGAGGGFLDKPIESAAGLIGGEEGRKQSNLNKAEYEQQFPALHEGMKAVGGIAPSLALSNPAYLGEEAATAIEAAPASQAIEKSPGLMRRGIAKVGSTLTGVPEQDVITYSGPRHGIINDMIKESGGDVGEMAGNTKNEILGDVNSARKEANDIISQHLKESGGGDNIVNIKPVIDHLDEAASSVNKQLNPQRIKEIEDLKDYVNSVADNKGDIMISDLYDLKKGLQEKAKGSYTPGGVFFQPSGEVAKAAKGAAAISREILHDAVPEIAEADDTLSGLRQTEKTMNKGLLNPRKSPAGLVGAGAGTNVQNAQDLERLGQITGKNLLQKAQDVSAAKTFSNPPLLPLDTTGKSMLRTGVGYKLGGMIGSVGGPVGREVGQVLGGAATSPAVLKKMIQAGKITGDMLSKYIGPVSLNTDQGIYAAWKALNAAGAPSAQ